jgi:hypothetical protein
MSIKNETTNFVAVSLQAFNGLNQNQNQNKSKSSSLEEMFKNYGKELDEGTEEIFGFLLDTELSDMESSPFETITEINMVFNKSKLLHPNQFALMQMNKNVYIENPKPGDWLRMNINDIEEGLANLKDKNQRPPEDSVKYTTTITEKMPR